MYTYLRKYRSPHLWWSIIIGCLCLLSKAFFFSFHALAHSCDSHHSTVSAVPILGCLRRLLLSLFIKLHSAPKYGVAWFIMKDFLSWILLRIILWLVVCIMPTPIKVVNQSWTYLQLEQYFSIICYHPPSWKLPSRLDMPLITCHKRLFVAFPMLFPMDSSWLVKSAYKKKWFGIINDVHHPYSCGEVHLSHQVLLKFTKLWTVFALSWSEYVRSLIHPLIIFHCPLADLNAACLPSQGPLYCPQMVNFSRSVEKSWCHFYQGFCKFG